MDPSRRYEFSWSLIGDLALGRPNLGPSVRLEVYRLMLFCFRDVVEARLGAEEADRVFREAGHLAGHHAFRNLIAPVADMSAFIRKAEAVLRELGVGVLRVESADSGDRRLVLTVSEDVDCSGLPEADGAVCTYDEGFLAGLLEAFTGQPFEAREVDCWCTGDRTCRFELSPSG